MGADNNVSKIRIGIGESDLGAAQSELSRVINGVLCNKVVGNVFVGLDTPSRYIVDAILRFMWARCVTGAPDLYQLDTHGVRGTATTPIPAGLPASEVDALVERAISALWSIQQRLADFALIETAVTFVIAPRGTMYADQNRTFLQTRATFRELLRGTVPASPGRPATPVNLPDDMALVMAEVLTKFCEMAKATPPDTRRAWGSIYNFASLEVPYHELPLLPAETVLGQWAPPAMTHDTLSGALAGPADVLAADARSYIGVACSHLSRALYEAASAMSDAHIGLQTTCTLDGVYRERVSITPFVPLLGLANVAPGVDLYGAREAAPAADVNDVAKDIANVYHNITASPNVSVMTAAQYRSVFKFWRVLTPRGRRLVAAVVVPNVEPAEMSALIATRTELTQQPDLISYNKVPTSRAEPRAIAILEAVRTLVPSDAQVRAIFEELPARRMALTIGVSASGLRTLAAAMSERVFITQPHAMFSEAGEEWQRELSYRFNLDTEIVGADDLLVESEGTLVTSSDPHDVVRFAIATDFGTKVYPYGEGLAEIRGISDDNVVIRGEHVRSFSDMSRGEEITVSLPRYVYDVMQGSRVDGTVDVSAPLTWNLAVGAPPEAPAVVMFSRAARRWSDLMSELIGRLYESFRTGDLGASVVSIPGEVDSNPLLPESGELGEMLRARLRQRLHMRLVKFVTSAAPRLMLARIARIRRRALNIPRNEAEARLHLAAYDQLVRQFFMRRWAMHPGFTSLVQDALSDTAFQQMATEELARPGQE